MSFVEMTNAEWQAVYQHHDALIHMAELELQAEQIRETCPDANQPQLLQPIEVQLHQLDAEIAGLPA
ncbi:MAG TPA: hypothetical protein VFS86_10970 [Rhodanobacteraceae bacterium]|jgi:hypothetical protein|nr:hypothetical protein [Rhodanobacteraceae bacterium]